MNRTTRKLLVAAALFAIVPTARDARADVCTRDRLPPRFPPSISIGPADFGAAAPACLYHGVALDGRGSLQLATANFYGTVLAEGVLSGSYAVSDRFAITAAFTALRFRFVQNATVIVNELSLGPTSVGGHFVAYRTEQVQITPFVRLLLPTDTAYRYGISMGGEAGAAVTVAADARWTVHGTLSLPLALAVTGGHVRAHFSPRMIADVGFAPWPFVEILLGAELRAGTDPAGGLELFAPRAAVRVGIASRFYAQLAWTAPLAGIEPTDQRAALTLGATF